MVNENSLLQEIENMKSKIQVLEDKEAIRDVVSRYAFNVDLGRLDNFLKLWTDDCMFATDGTGEMVYRRGKDEIRELLVGLPKYTQHLQLDYVITVDGDTAVATGYQLISIHSNNEFGIARCALRTFQLQRVDGNWLIKEAISHSITNEDGCQKIVPNNF